MLFCTATILQTFYTQQKRITIFIFSSFFQLSVLFLVVLVLKEQNKNLIRKIFMIVVTFYRQFFMRILNVERRITHRTFNDNQLFKNCIFKKKHSNFLGQNVFLTTQLYCIHAQNKNIFMEYIQTLMAANIVCMDPIIYELQYICQFFFKLRLYF